MERRYETPRAVRLQVANAAGDVLLTGHDLPVTEVEVTALSKDAQDLVDRTTVEQRETGTGHLVTVAVPRPGGFGLRFGHRAEVRVLVRLPAGADVVVKSASADITARGRFHTGDLRTQSGGVDVDEFTGRLDVHSGSGPVRVSELGGSGRLRTASGDLTVDRARGRLEVASASGDVHIGQAITEVSAMTASGQVRIDAALAGVDARSASGALYADGVREGRVVARSASGDITVGVARGVRLHVDAVSGSGTLDSEIPLDDRDTGGADGGPPVELALHTASGNVRLLRTGAG